VRLQLLLCLLLLVWTGQVWVVHQQQQGVGNLLLLQLQLLRPGLLLGVLWGLGVRAPLAHCQL
jgi:hypothetical protein